jgi:hypothetical protein
MLKKILVLALTAMALAAASASVASANWTYGGEALPAGANPHLQLTSQWSTTSIVIGGIDCQIDITVELTGGTTTGHVTQFEIDLTGPEGTPTKKCVTSGPLSPCLVKGVHATNLPWTVHSDGADKITITTGEIDNTLENQTGGVCGVVQQTKIKPGTVTTTIPAGKTSAIEQLTLSGQLEASTGSKTTVEGTQSVALYGTA